MKRIALGSVVTVGMGVVACGGAPRPAAAQPQPPAGIAAPALAARRELDVRTPDGLTLHAWSTGDERAPVVLVVHGGPGLSHDYLDALDALATRGYRVVQYDQRGVGQSAAPPQKDGKADRPRTRSRATTRTSRPCAPRPAPRACT